MNSKNKVIITYGLWAIDVVAIVISYIASMFVRFHIDRAYRDINVYVIVGLLFVLFATMYTFMIPWHNGFMKRKAGIELWHIVKLNAVIIILTQTIMFFLKWADLFSRWVMVYFAVINVALTYAFHMIFKQVMKTYYRSDHNKTKALVITQKSLLDSVKAKINDSLDLSYQVLDILVTEELPDDFFEKAGQMAVDEVFIYAPDFSQKSVNEIITFFDEGGVRCSCCIEIPGLDPKRSHVGTFASYSVISYDHFQSSYKRLLIKRLMDIVGGLIGCVITIVMTPFVAIAIKLNSKGPVFFTQTRIGRNGRRFKILKFRSMYIDAEERKKELIKDNEVEGLMFKMENDPRITKVGRFIRKTSIDELPQFFNVVKGDMSLVGTRPPTEDEFEKYNQYYRRRISMTPGLTGLWQVSGRSNIDNFDDVVKFDLEYIDNWSLTLDMKILLKTIWVVFAGKGSK